ncbi:hypothetical protein PTSG_06295 [Salpingoeca rosetta]|uniref:Uncharacterized protein n=1 Tax=Salpingoeca rosetta (strain ATCC 50818 / BSB-021) TaxID=946362 RepID=F2UCH9_SALR5|nr:uncharacterized protein PTSG_06295 [Salpingoeca rosetta]EGD74286.1 hypothetical protein PTSG_06295 [Salpingoeca rosetta]|eukprot:XP_004993186.1 hypothetical protein PTSG_06295 [Salpingoeca rosetta]
METGEQHDKLPVPQPLDLFDDPRDWVEEKATDGTVTWFNPRFMLVSLVRPPSHKEGASPFCHWFSIEAPGKGRGYVHKFTREVIYRDITQERSIHVPDKLPVPHPLDLFDDPRDWVEEKAPDGTCEATRQIELRPKAFDLDEAEEFRNMNILFMCSFRSATDHSDNHLAETMRLQEKWMNFLRPAASRLRFFLPWPSKRGEGGATEYIDGQLRFPLWGINTGTECTMFVTDPEARRTFSFRDFEGLMFHHNVITRTTYYEHSVQGEGLDHCYDCSAEIFILSQWIRSANPGLDEEEVRREVSKLSYDISRIISNGSRTLKVT